MIVLWQFFGRRFGVGTFKIVSRTELRMRKKMPPEDVALFDQFKLHLSRMDGSDAGVYEFAKGEDHHHCRKILRRAAKALDIPIRVIQEENSLVFYRRKRKRQKNDQ